MPAWLSLRVDSALHNCAGCMKKAIQADRLPFFRPSVADIMRLRNRLPLDEEKAWIRCDWCRISPRRRSAEQAAAPALPAAPPEAMLSFVAGDRDRGSRCPTSAL